MELRARTSEEMTAMLRECIDAGMFASFPRFLFGSGSGPILQEAVFREQANAHSELVPARPLNADTLKRVQNGLRWTIAQIEARERDAKVSDAISAMHSNYKPDGRPHSFDPWRRS